MNPTRPSRQALQALSRLCHNVETSIPKSAATHRALCTHVHIQAQRHSCRPHSKNNHTSKPISSRHTFTTTHHPKVQPNTTTDTDPQNQAAPLTLPDITDYYTLFPTTLPQGPPSPPTPTQSPPPPEDSTSSSPSRATFTIHLPTLRQEFLRLQSTHHPDKFPTGSQAHHKALALSSLINTAYKTLSDPLLRAQYLLQIQHDIDVTTEDNAAHPTDQETLMEVMEAQERVEGAKSQEEVDALKRENAERIVVTERVLGEAFEQGDVVKAKDEAVRLKYWRSLQDALNDWEEGKEVRLIH